MAEWARPSIRRSTNPTMDRSTRAPPPCHPHLPDHQRHHTRYTSIPHYANTQAMISGWFLDAPFEELRKEDLETFVAWMLLQKDAEGVRFVVDWVGLE